MAKRNLLFIALPCFMSVQVWAMDDVQNYKEYLEKTDKLVFSEAVRLRREWWEKIHESSQKCFEYLRVSMDDLQNAYAELKNNNITKQEFRKKQAQLQVECQAFQEKMGEENAHIQETYGKKIKAIDMILEKLQEEEIESVNKLSEHIELNI